jgi:hypothetical protein
VTTAPQENRGGFRPDAGQNNVGVSATGGNGSADGVPNTNYTGFAYGENKKINSTISSGLPMGQPSMTGTSGAGMDFNTLLSETDNPAEPITAGATVGAGPGREVLPKSLTGDIRDQENAQIVAKYIPMLVEATKIPDAPDSYKRFVNSLIDQLPQGPM